MLDINFDGTLDGVHAQLDEHSNYRESIKPPKAAEKFELESLYNRITLKLRSDNRPAYVPPEGHSVEVINALWKGLGDAEASRLQALQNELEKQQKLRLLRHQFKIKADRLEEWITEKDEYAQTQENVESLLEAQAKLKTLEAVQQEYTDSKARLDALQLLKDQIVELSSDSEEPCIARCADITSKWTALAPALEAKQAGISLIYIYIYARTNHLLSVMSTIIYIPLSPALTHSPTQVLVTVFFSVSSLSNTYLRLNLHRSR